ncbi:unnamed protein product [Ambrosiozyma monospora]|uniref:Unnamed protein product n=1 Tax=Ambrosiozyma monospora TaxID=43982 RepID=A0ACB5U9U1_AMBMO|nr:unnamed protein product [Ambrosiozyma monospora]
MWSSLEQTLFKAGDELADTDNCLCGLLFEGGVVCLDTVPLTLPSPPSISSMAAKSASCIASWFNWASMLSEIDLIDLETPSIACLALEIKYIVTAESSGDRQME